MIELGRMREGYRIYGNISSYQDDIVLAEYKTREKAESEMLRFINHIGNTSGFEFLEDKEV